MTTDRSLRTFFVALVLVAQRGREPLVRERGRRDDEVRSAGARRLVRQRPDRQAVPAQLLRGGDRRRSRTTSGRTSTPRRSSRARSRARCTATSSRAAATRAPTARRTTARGSPAVGATAGTAGTAATDDGSNPNGGDDPGQAAPDVDTSSPSSVPIPLLVLGGMSILLLARGRARIRLAPPPGSARRRVRRRRSPRRSARRPRGPGGYNQWVVRSLISLQIADKFSVGTAPYPPLPARMTNVAHRSGKS